MPVNRSSSSNQQNKNMTIYILILFYNHANAGKHKDIGDTTTLFTVKWKFIKSPRSCLFQLSNMEIKLSTSSLQPQPLLLLQAQGLSLTVRLAFPQESWQHPCEYQYQRHNGQHSTRCWQPMSNHQGRLSKKWRGEEAMALNAAVKDDNCPLRPTLNAVMMSRPVLQYMAKILAVVLENIVRTKSIIEEIFGMMKHNIGHIWSSRSAGSPSSFGNEESWRHCIVETLETASSKEAIDAGTDHAMKLTLITTSHTECLR